MLRVFNFLFLSKTGDFSLKSRSTPSCVARRRTKSLRSIHAFNRRPHRRLVSAHHRTVLATERNAVDILFTAAQFVQTLRIVLVPNLFEGRLRKVIHILWLVAALDFNHDTDTPRTDARGENNIGKTSPASPLETKVPVGNPAQAKSADKNPW